MLIERNLRILQQIPTEGINTQDIGKMLHEIPVLLEALYRQILHDQLLLLFIEGRCSLFFVFEIYFIE